MLTVQCVTSGCTGPAPHVTRQVVKLFARRPVILDVIQLT